MKKQYLLLFYVCFPVLQGYTQSFPSDSLKKAYHNIFFQEVYSVYTKTGSLLRYVPVKEYTASSLYYKNTTGNFRQGQAPNIRHDIGMNTNGFFRGKNVTYYGEIDLYKTYIHDLSWNLSYQDLEDGMMADPHYFAVSRPGNWSNQTFHLTGGIIFPVLGEKVLASTEVNFDVYNKFRSNMDPRPEITYSELNFKSTIAYEIAKYHRINFGGSYGYFYVNNDITFNNSDINTPYYYSSFVRWITGYGTMIGAFRDDSKRRNRQWSTLFNYLFDNSATKVLAGLNYRKSITHTYKSNQSNPNKEEDVMATLNSETLSGQFTYLNYQNINKVYKIQWSALLNNGSNFLTSKGGKNYQSKKIKSSLGASMIEFKQNSDVNYDTGISLSYLMTDQKDALASTAIKNAFLQASYYLRKDYRLHRKLLLIPSVRIAYQQNIQHTFINGNTTYLESIREDDYAGLALKTYYEEVVYYDNMILSQNSLYGDLGIDLRFLQLNNFNLTLRLREQVSTGLSSSSQRWQTNISVILDY
ncbi:DUF6850 family outer membrane beta-barrel protein [Sinomicrobium sp. M5D2P9]